MGGKGLVLTFVFLFHAVAIHHVVVVHHIVVVHHAAAVHAAATFMASMMSASHTHESASSEDSFVEFFLLIVIETVIEVGHGGGDFLFIVFIDGNEVIDESGDGFWGEIFATFDLASEFFSVVHDGIESLFQGRFERF